MYDYQAVKEDEISVTRGEIVQVVFSNQQNMFLVYRPANAHSPVAEGWIPKDESSLFVCWLFACLEVFVPLEIFSLIWRRHH